MVNKITTPPTTSELIGKVNEIIDGKQDTLVSGTNIKTINGNSLLGSGNIDIQSGSSYTAGTGISISNNTISVANPTLTNTATGTDSLTILGTANSNNKAVNIGIQSQGGYYTTSVGYGAVCSGTTSTSIGYLTNVTAASATSVGTQSEVSALYGIAIGRFAKATATYAIQLGQGTNSEANSFYVGTSTSNNWKMLGSDGKIPSDRISIDGTTITVNSSGQLQASGGGGSYTAGTGIDITNDVISVEGVKDQRNTSTAIKTWTGTKAQYDAIVTKDNNTLYNITDDISITSSILEILYPVGSIYITTASTCPLSTLISGSTWQLVSSGRVLQGADSGHSAGTTIEAGLPNITGSGSTIFTGNTRQSQGCISYSNITNATWVGGSSSSVNTTLNIDASQSNAIYGNSNTVQPPAYVVNIFRRTL